MNLATLEVPEDQARQALIHYRAARKLARNAEDDAIIRGYNQIVKGRKLIELSRVIAAGGVDEQRRPRLAVIRADFRECHVHATWQGEVSFGPTSSRHWKTRGKRVSFPEDTLPRWNANPWSVDARSVVPLIPPQHRPADDLSRYHILWEATWEDVPSDPALLQHLGGDLWAVLAVWDLTPLEMAVLRGRASS